MTEIVARGHRWAPILAAVAPEADVSPACQTGDSHSPFHAHTGPLRVLDAPDLGVLEIAGLESADEVQIARVGVQALHFDHLAYTLRLTVEEVPRLEELYAAALAGDEAFTPLPGTHNYVRILGDAPLHTVHLSSWNGGSSNMGSSHISAQSVTWFRARTAPYCTDPFDGRCLTWSYAIDLAPDALIEYAPFD